MGPQQGKDFAESLISLVVGVVVVVAAFAFGGQGEMPKRIAYFYDCSLAALRSAGLLCVSSEREFALVEGGGIAGGEGRGSAGGGGTVGVLVRRRKATLQLTRLTSGKTQTTLNLR